MDLSTAPRGALQLPNPVLTASGCAAAGRELDQFFDVTALGARRHQVGDAPAAVRAGPRRGWPRPRAGCSTRSACRARASTPSSTTTCRGCVERGRPGGGVDRRQHRRGVRRAGRSGCAGSRAWRAVEVNISCPNVEDRGPRLRLRPRARPPRSSAAVRGRRTRAAGASPSCPRTSPTSWRSPRPCVEAGADGLSLINTLLGLAIDTGDPAARAGRGHRRAVRPRDQSGRGALRLAGARGDAARCRSSGMGGIRTGTRRPASSCSPARARSRSARRCSTTRARRPRVLGELRGRARGARLRRVWPTRSGTPHRVATDRAEPGRRRSAGSGSQATGPGPSRGRARPIAPTWTRRTRRGAGRAAVGDRHVSTLKVGLELFCRYGRPRCRGVRGGERRPGVFLDLKLHDIPATVAGSGPVGGPPATPSFLTVHACRRGGHGRGPRWGAARRPGSPAVTVLTSLSAADLDGWGSRGRPRTPSAGWPRSPSRRGPRPGLLAAGSRRGRGRGRQRLTLVTPGCAPAGSPGDQMRVATPEEALAAGADLLRRRRGRSPRPPTRSAAAMRGPLRRCCDRGRGRSGSGARRCPVPRGLRHSRGCRRRAQADPAHPPMPVR